MSLSSSDGRSFDLENLRVSRTSESRSSRLLQPIEPNKNSLLSRRMNTGPCEALIRAGKYQVNCPCDEGVFIVASGSTLEISCTECGHCLADHKDSDVTVRPPPTKSSAFDDKHHTQELAAC